jgi:cation transport regulator ChaC
VLPRQVIRESWVFAYGSLMWDPAIHIVEIKRATLQGFHRRFCLKAEIGRGSKKAPALMAALHTGGECHGLAFRIPANAVNHETEILWMREMIGEAYIPLFQTVVTPRDRLLAFVMTERALASPNLAARKRLLSSQPERANLGRTSSISTIWPATLRCLASRMKWFCRKGRPI